MVNAHARDPTHCCLRPSHRNAPCSARAMAARKMEPMMPWKMPNNPGWQWLSVQEPYGHPRHQHEHHHYNTIAQNKSLLITGSRPAGPKHMNKLPNVFPTNYENRSCPSLKLTLMGPCKLIWRVQNSLHYLEKNVLSATWFWSVL